MKFTNIDQSNIKEAESFFLKAKKAYYEGNPFISDAEFDALQDLLDDYGSGVTLIVGDPDQGGKFEHPSKMLSLDKVHGGEMLDSDEKNFRKLINWLDSVERVTGPGVSFNTSMKLDGNSLNLVYKNGKLDKALSRGNGTLGQDVTRHAQHLNNIPKPIEADGLVEVRGEVVISQEVFDKHYSKNSPAEHKHPKVEGENARNFVSGQMNPVRTELYSDVLSDMDFVAFDVRYHSDDGQVTRSAEDPSELGFESPKSLDESIMDRDMLELCVKQERDKLVEIYEHMLQIRSSYKYPTDGMVIKVSNEEQRNLLGEGKKAPKWALSIKFPAVQIETVILEIEPSATKDGNVYPTAIVSPVYVDGSRVRRAALYNYGNVLENKFFPGARVRLEKGGDIIPKIVELVEPSKEAYELPKEFDGVELYLEGIHLRMKDPEKSSGTHIKRLQKIFKILELDKWGSSWAEELYSYGIKTVEGIFTIDKQQMIASGMFKQGRTLDLKFESLDGLQQVELSKLINSIQTQAIGSTLSERLAEEFAGMDPDYSGLNSAGIEAGRDAFDRLESLIDIVEGSGRKVIYPSEEDAEQEDVLKTFEMTGSPKDFGYAKKKDFVDYVASLGYKHTKLDKDTDFLITDDIDSSSSKMKKAKEYGVKIITYDQIK